MASTALTRIRILRRSLRVHQWAKNLLIFVPLVLGGRAADAAAWQAALIGFVALCCVASAGYLINDLGDLNDDRNHWSKRLRPLASGELAERSAVLMAAVGIVLGGALALYLGIAALLALALYLALTTAYSFYLKRVPILDVFTLASLYTFRLAFGIVLTDVRLSPWLLIFSMFVFLALSLVKRHTELARLTKENTGHSLGRGYLPQDLPIVLGLGLAASLGAVLIVILYLIEDAFPRNFYSHPYALWSIPPILFLFLARLWLLSQRGLLRDDPVAFALKDGVSLLLGLLMGAGFVLALL